MVDKALENDPLTPQGGFAQNVGYRLDTWEEGRADVVLEIAPHHLNRSGVMHGGVLTTLIDTACGFSGCYCKVPGNARRAMTLQLTAQFLAPAQEGARVTAAARVVGGGRSVFFADCEVRSEDGRLLGRGEGVFKYRPGSESPEGQPVG